MSSSEGHHLVKIKLGKRSAGSQASRAGSCIFMGTPSLPTTPLPASCQPAGQLGSPGGSGARGMWFLQCPIPTGHWEQVLGWEELIPCLRGFQAPLSFHSPPVSFLYTLQLWGPGKGTQQTRKCGIQGPLPVMLASLHHICMDFTREPQGALSVLCSHLQTLLHNCPFAPCGLCL